MREDFALRDRAFETPLARRWRKEQEERTREEQEALETEHRRELEREALKLKAELAELRVDLAMRRMAWDAECAEHKRRSDLTWERFKTALMRGDFAPGNKANFNSDQPRDELGRWTAGGGRAVTPPTSKVWNSSRPGW